MGYTINLISWRKLIRDSYSSSSGIVACTIYLLCCNIPRGASRAIKMVMISKKCFLEKSRENGKNNRARS